MSVVVTDGDDLDFSAVTGSTSNNSKKDENTGKPAAGAVGKARSVSTPKKEN
jgi:hypothetical protein